MDPEYYCPVKSLEQSGCVFVEFLYTNQHVLFTGSRAQDSFHHEFHLHSLLMEVDTKINIWE
jgi:hypothetical protein